MKVGIVANPELKGLNEFIRRALSALKGHDVLLESCISEKHPKLSAKLSDLDVDCIITIGGDGTVLYTLQNIPTQVPILPIRAGLLGFLTEIDKADIEDGISRLIAGEYIIDERMRISSSIDGTKLPDALNEVVIHTSQIAKLRHFNVKIDGQLMTTVRADGLIFATPTGSTSYAL
ncbi:MAG: NAD(+)/NADH kinase, partial [Thermoplasmata archaeon]|nr:NAD(+)/NADH kinase [Thermoplasmata archaeon]